MSALQITNQELQTSFDFSEVFVKEMKTKADALTISGVDDKDGYNAINDARKLIKEKRVAVEKKRNELNADALAYQRTVNAEAKRITSMLEPIEQELSAKTKAIDSEKERIKLEERRLRQEKTAGRIGQMVAMNMTQIGGMYYVGNQRISHNEVETWDDEIWTDFVHICQREYDEQQKLIAEAQAAAIAAAQREADEREAERKRLETIAQEQKAEAERLKKISNEQAKLLKEMAKDVKGELRETDFAQWVGFDMAKGPDTAVEVEGRIDGNEIVISQSKRPYVNSLVSILEPNIPKNRRAMARANATCFLCDRGILQAGATEFVISFVGNRPPVDLVELMGEFLSEFWSVPI